MGQLTLNYQRISPVEKFREHNYYKVYIKIQRTDDMATKKSTASTRGSRASGGKKSAATKNYKAEYERNSARRRQMSAIILFTVGILLLAVVLIKGESVWQWLHNMLFGLFAVPVIILPTALIFVAIMATLDKPIGEIKHKVWQSLALVGIVCALVEICSAEVFAGEGFFKVIAGLYTDGVAMRGGGVFSAVLGWVLYAACGKVGAIIIIVLLMFAFFMLLTGATLIGFFKGLYHPVKKIEEGYVQRREAIEQERARRFNINVDLGPEGKSDELPNHPVSSPRAESKELEIISKAEQRRAEKQEKQSKRDEAAQKHIRVASEQLDDLIKRAVDPPLTAKEEKKETARIIHEQAVSLAQESSKMLADSTTQMSEYAYPPASLLKAPIVTGNRDVSEELKANAALLVDTLKSFGVQTRVIDISRGPTVTRYELQPSAGVKISKITGLADDIALNLAAAGVRIEAPIPNKAAVGIEVPNKKTDIVTMREIIESSEFSEAKSHLSVALGRDIAGNCIIADIAKMPHMLIAGATGSGKSVCINSIIISILYKSPPSEVRLVMVDPKVVELGVYNGIPHLLVPVVTDPRKAAGALGWAVTEMLNRYKLFAENNVRDLTGYNAMAAEREDVDPMPQIVIIIDELADLMMAAPNEVEDSICRLAQMARAAGMHLIIATQRPSVDVITGVIKANIPSRIAFAVSSQVDSRTILDGGGAEKLLGRGDMLFSPVGMPKPIRVQGCFVSDKEVEAVVEFVKNKETVKYDDKIIEEIEKQSVQEKGSNDSNGGGGFDDADELLSDAIECVIDAGQASTSYLQRKLKVGYARAARLIDDMESKGIVGAFEGSKPRQILISRQQWLEMSMNNSTNAPPSAQAAPMANSGTADTTVPFDTTDE